MFRREWRQQIVVLVLLSVTVAAAVFAAIAAYNLPPSESAEFGSAERRITLSSPDSAALQSEVAKLADQYAPVEMIWHAQLPVPGSVETVDLRAEDPQGLYSRPLLSLLDGHYPTKAGEVAVTNGVAAMFGVGVGDQLTVLTEPWTVVGLRRKPDSARRRVHPHASGRSARLGKGQPLVQRPPRRAPSACPLDPAVHDPGRRQRLDAEPRRRRIADQPSSPPCRWTRSRCCWCRSWRPPVSWSSPSAGCVSSGCWRRWVQPAGNCAW